MTDTGESASTTVSRIRETLREHESRLQKLCPPGITAARIISTVCQSLESTPGLRRCDLQSVLLCARDAAIAGLEVGGHRPQAHMVSYGRACKLVPSYQGLLALARRSGEVQSAAVGVVREGDSFSPPEDPLTPVLIHSESRDPDRHKAGILYVWSGFLLRQGARVYDWMSRGEAEAHGRRFAPKFSSPESPWQTNFEAMALKTVIRRPIARGLVPISSEHSFIFNNEDGAAYSPETPAAAEVNRMNHTPVRTDAPANRYIDDADGSNAEVSEAK